MEKLFIHEGNSIKIALKKFKYNIYKTFIVVDKNKKLLGTLTDGDLRKQIIKKVNINNKIKNFFFKINLLIKKLGDWSQKKNFY